MLCPWCFSSQWLWKWSIELRAFPCPSFNMEARLCVLFISFFSDCWELCFFIFSFLTPFLAELGVCSKVWTYTLPLFLVELGGMQSLGLEAWTVVSWWGCSHSLSCSPRILSVLFLYSWWEDFLERLVMNLCFIVWILCADSFSFYFMLSASFFVNFSFPS